MIFKGSQNLHAGCNLFQDFCQIVEERSRAVEDDATMSGWTASQPAIQYLPAVPVTAPVGRYVDHSRSCTAHTAPRELLTRLDAMGFRHKIQIAFTFYHYNRYSLHSQQSISCKRQLKYQVFITLDMNSELASTVINLGLKWTASIFCTLGRHFPWEFLQNAPPPYKIQKQLIFVGMREKET